jgi:hypothetical protein
MATDWEFENNLLINRIQPSILRDPEESKDRMEDWDPGSNNLSFLPEESTSGHIFSTYCSVF